MHGHIVAFDQTSVEKMEGKLQLNSCILIDCVKLSVDLPIIVRKGSLKNLSAERQPTVGWQIFRGTLLYKYHWSSVDHNKLKKFSVPYLPVCKSIFYRLKICPKNLPRLIHGSKAEIKKSSGQISITIVSHGNKHPLLHGTSYGVFSLINLSSWS